VQADDKEGVLGETEREMRVVRGAADAWVPVVKRGVAFVEHPELPPEQLLERGFVQTRRLFERRDERRELALDRLGFAKELVQVVAEARRRLRAREPVVDRDLRRRRYGTFARKSGVLSSGTASLNDGPRNAAFPGESFLSRKTGPPPPWYHPSYRRAHGRRPPTSQSDNEFDRLDRSRICVAGNEGTGLGRGNDRWRGCGPDAHRAHSSADGTRL
jgi:hypothetical protein